MRLSVASTYIRRKAAATLLHNLRVIKAFSDEGRINGPNVQRFGQFDPSSGRWRWIVEEIVAEARQRKACTEQEIKIALSQLQSLQEPPKTTRYLTKAERMESFREAVHKLELGLKRHAKLQQQIQGTTTLG